MLAVGSMAFCFMGLMMLMSTIGKTERARRRRRLGDHDAVHDDRRRHDPLAFMPGWMQTVSNISPVKWGILALEGAIWRDFTLTEMLLPCSILLGIGAVAFAAGVKLLSRQEVCCMAMMSN